MQTILFHKETGIEPKLCFVVMPFNSALKNVYDAIKSTIDNYCGLKCKRADEISNSGRITNDIWKNISKARFLIADLTDRNPNVFYELGLAHALNKQVILLTQNTDEVPFDLREIRYITYDSNNLASLRTELIEYAKECISTIPENWNKDFRPPGWEEGYIKIIDLKAPQVISEGQPFEIYVKARNSGKSIRQGYFSVSFPAGVEKLSIESSAFTMIGMKNDFWSGERHILEYPIAEGFKHDRDNTGDPNQSWPAGWVHHIKVRGYARRKGLLWFYVNASCAGNSEIEWIWDPYQPLLDVDQRDEAVYCGVIEVV
jgi:hypothetical protein